MSGTLKLDLVTHCAEVFKVIEQRNNTTDVVPKTYIDFITTHSKLINELPSDATEYRLPVIELCEGRPIGLHPPLRFQFVYKEEAGETRQYVDFLAGEALLPINYFPIWLNRSIMQEFYDDRLSMGLVGSLQNAIAKGRYSNHPGNDKYIFGEMNHLFGMQYDLLRVAARWEKVEWPDKDALAKRHQDHLVELKQYVVPGDVWWRDPVGARSDDDAEHIIAQENRY